MGVTIEFYCIPPGATARSLAGARTAGRMVSSASINSVVIGELLNSLQATPLKGLFSGPEGRGVGILIDAGHVAAFGSDFAANSNGRALELREAVEDAVDEAVWRGCGLWIGAT